jgi:hypothetical protein
LREELGLRVVENKVLRRMFGPRGDEVTRMWRKLHNEKLHYLYSSPTIVQVIKSRRMKWAEHVARLGRKVAYTGVEWGILRERDHWGYPGIDWRIILRWIFRKWDEAVWTRLGWINKEAGGGHL